MLDERKAAILRAVVEQYIETAQPVGSSHVAHKGVVDVSPATVRNEMAVLEREGFLVQPHTSAGRIPTDKAYRYYVDQIAPGPLPAPQRQTVKQFFDSAHGAIEQMLHDTSRLLSDLTDTAAVVVGPAHEAATIRALQLVGLQPRLALLVLVLSNGVIEKRTVELPEDTSEELLSVAGAHLNRALVGRVLQDVGPAPRTGADATDAIAAAALATVGPHRPQESDHTDVFVSGASRVARAFEQVDTVRDVLHILEQQYLVVSLLRDVLDRGLSVAIGAEAGLEPLAECAIVVAPYEIEGERAGTIGILGPTRMNYPQALSAVSVVSERLGRRLTEG